MFSFPILGWSGSNIYKVVGKINPFFCASSYFFRHCWWKIKSPLSKVVHYFCILHQLRYPTVCVWTEIEYVVSSLLCTPPARKSQGSPRFLLKLVNYSGLFVLLNWEARCEQQKEETLQEAIERVYHMLPKFITEVPRNLQIGCWNPWEKNPYHINKIP